MKNGGGKFFPFHYSCFEESRPVVYAARYTRTKEGKPGPLMQLGNRPFCVDLSRSPTSPQRRKCQGLGLLGEWIPVEARFSRKENEQKEKQSSKSCPSLHWFVQSFVQICG